VTENRGTTLSLSDDVGVFAHALEFALRKHREYGQTREDGVTPYGIHIIRVVERLRQVGLIDDFSVLAAAALHDVVEDCEVSVDEITTRYGERVALFVGEVTRRSGQNGREYVAQLAGASREGKTIKLADRWDNVLDLKTFRKPTFGDRPSSEYLEESKMVLSVCRGANVRLAGALEQSIRETLDEIARGSDIQE
jgi:guanosine-3',5'-bis(diphosphate) 3'-pyrophosphohydrolase